MSKQNYEKPIASFIAFYSEKDIASTQEVGGIDQYANDVESNPNDTSVGVVPGDPMNPDWN